MLGEEKRGCGDCVEVAGGGCLVLREGVRTWRRERHLKRDTFEGGDI